MRKSMSFLIQNVLMSIFLKKQTNKQKALQEMACFELLNLWEKQTNKKLHQQQQIENKITLKAISCRRDHKLTGEIWAINAIDRTFNLCYTRGRWLCTKLCMCVTCVKILLCIICSEKRWTLCISDAEWVELFCWGFWVNT